MAKDENICRLKGEENYAAWALRTKVAAKAQGLLEMLEGTDTEPMTGKNGKAWKGWRDRRNATTDLLFRRLEDAVLGHANDYIDDPAGLWAHLAAVFGDAGVGGAVRAWRRFSGIRFMGWDDKLVNVMGRVRTAADELERIHGDRPSDNQIIATMLSSCANHPEFKSTVASLESSKESLTVDDVELRLIRVEKDFKETSRTIAGFGGIGRTPALNDGRVDALMAGERLKCSNCGRLNHTVENCFQPGGAKEGQIPDWYVKLRQGSGATPAANAALVSSLDGASVVPGRFYAM